MASGKHSIPNKRGRGGSAAKPNKGIIAVIVVVIIAVVLGFAACNITRESAGEVAQGESINVAIPAGSTGDDIGKILKDSKVIATASEFTSRVKERGVGDQLKSGTYVLKGGDAIDTIIDVIVSGKSAAVTIPEGLTLKQIAERVEQACDVKADDFYALTQKADEYKTEYPFLADCYEGSMEGFLFPDTYEIPTDLSADALLREMLDGFSEKIATVDMSYAKSKNLTVYDVITLASMVEEESRHDDDRTKIAGVFYNRLHENMTLGSDVTTYYAVGKDPTEELTKEDLNSDSPYNTRNPKNHGLPAGPICNPGLPSIEAAAKPDTGKELYFFYSASRDETMFYEDQASFNAAWAKYGE